MRRLGLTMLMCLGLLATTVSAEPPREFPGRIEALNHADVSNAIASLITEVHFKPGQRVQTGEPLYSLDATDFELALDTERANYLRAEATLKSAEQDFLRITQLRERGSATDVQMLKAEVAQAFADAVRAETQANLKAAEINLGRTVIRAPISGVIGPSRVSEGTFVKKGAAPLATIVQLDPVRLSYRVPYTERIDELDLEDLRFPDSLLSRITLEVKVSDEWIYPMQTRPTHVSSDVDPETGEITIWAELPNPLGQLRPGMAVTVISTFRAD